MDLKDILIATILIAVPFGLAAAVILLPLILDELEPPADQAPPKGDTP